MRLRRILRIELSVVALLANHHERRVRVSGSLELPGRPRDMLRVGRTPRARRNFNQDKLTKDTPTDTHMPAVISVCVHVTCIQYHTRYRVHG
jgi:hypothetical protein